MSKHPVVAIIGRMNVGKSTLFNRLSSSVKSLTLDYAGVTRDVVRDTVEWAGKQFELVDTGGVSFVKTSDIIQEKVRQQALAFVDAADVLLFVVDGSVGPTAEDQEIVRYVRKLNKKIILCVNKSDKKTSKDHIPELTGLGFELILISAEHGLGIGDLLDKIIEVLPSGAKKSDEQAAFRVMLLGRPNVGKSSLMNALLQHERSIVSEVPGTTREAITEPISFYKQTIALTDTPGIRRPKSVTEQLESMMVKSAFGALRGSDIVLMLIDGTQGKLVGQDLKLAFYAFTQQYKALIILINKADIMTPQETAMLEESLEHYGFLADKVPVLRISAKTGKNIGKIMPAVTEVWQRHNQQLKASEVLLLFQEELRKRPLVHAEQHLKVFDVKQTSSAPITLVLTVNIAQMFGPSELAFFENILRKKYDLKGVPVKLVAKRRN